MQAAFPVRVAQEMGGKSLRPILCRGSAVACKCRVLASEMVHTCLWQDSSRDSAECRGGGKCVLIWDPEPGGRRKCSAFVLK